MPVKHVRAKNLAQAKRKAKHAIPKGKHVKNVNMMDKTAGRKTKSYSVTYNRKHKITHKRAKLDLSLKGKNFGASWEPGDRKRHVKHHKVHHVKHRVHHHHKK